MSTKHKPVVIWLLFGTFLVWLMVMLGGATRLTHSGLSMVVWKPITGIIPPLSQADWLEAFELYKQYPEYKVVNFGMTLDQFKFIYLMEYTHRVLGRLIGLVFLLPLVFFWAKGYFTTQLKKRTVTIFLLGALQGLMGWYMVKSGLVKDPAVSHYRLTAHLFLAVLIVGFILWTAFDLLREGVRSSIPHLASLSRITLMFSVLTITYGGLVAGLQAGLIYNSFPLMEGQFLPSEWSAMVPFWKNFVENPTTVQFLHRWLGILTFIHIVILFFKTRVVSDKVVRQSGGLVLLAGLLQGSLGILTLLQQVPVSLATLHQGMAIIVFSLLLWIHHQTRSVQNLSSGHWI